MIVAGARGLAKELLEILFQRKALDNLYFFDNISADGPAKLFDTFPILTSFDEVKQMFKQTGDVAFCLGLGNPVLRHRLCRQFMEVGGRLTSVVSPKAEIGNFGISIGEGCCILSGAVITSDVRVGGGCLVNPNATISHDSQLGDFVEISPGVNVTGNCSIGEFSFLGANATILPKVRVGTNAVIGAGAVVTKDIPDNSMAVGVPARVIRTLPALSF